jgi:hypothetical protein
MTSSHAIHRDGRAGWTLMTAIHDALRRDLDQLLLSTAGHTPPRARWIMFAGQLRFHLTAEAAALWSPTRAQAGRRPTSQASLDAMEDQQQLIRPPPAVIDDAITVNLACPPGRDRLNSCGGFKLGCRYFNRKKSRSSRDRAGQRSLSCRMDLI